MSSDERKDPPFGDSTGDYRAADGAPRPDGRDQADIARLLRALNDDLRDDNGSGASPDPAAIAAPPASDRRGASSRRPSVVVVGVGVLAAAALGLGSFMFIGGKTPSPSGAVAPAVVAGQPGVANGDSPPSLISRAPDPNANASAAPSAPPVIPPAAAPQTPARLLTPGQTATVLRPLPPPPPEPVIEEAPPAAATVMVQPLAPSPPAPVVRPPAAAPAPAPVAALPPAKPPVVKPAPAPAPVLAPGPGVLKPPPGAVPVVPAAPSPAITAAPSHVAPAASPGGPGRFAVQVGTFSVAGNADQLIKRLAQHGMRAYIIQWRDRQQKEWTAVRIGNFASDQAARAAVGDLKNRMDLTGQIINLH